MGCVCAKPSEIGDGRKNPVDRAVRKQISNGVSQTGLRREDSQVIDRSESVRAFLVDKVVNGSIRMRDDYSEKFRKQFEDVYIDRPDVGVVPKAREGEQVAAGWPSWLAAAAGEAINGLIPRGVDTFKKLDKIGQGTYSSVYKARDLIHDKTVALKRVRFDNLDPESITFMAREILVLRRLDHPKVIKLEGLIISQTTGTLYLIFEYMEHDLMGLASLPGLKFTETQVKCYMKQLLSGLDHCHSNGVLHRDIKAANLLIDNCGVLKIADFGLAKFYDPCHSYPLTSRVVTLWYRPPELLLGAMDYGPAVDLWSTGCILGELFAGKPIMPGRTEVEQLHKIFKLCGSPSDDFWMKSKLRYSKEFRPQQPYRRRVAERFKDVPAAALGLIETLLSTDPDCRGTAASALNSEFFIMEPLACDPSSLPKYPPSKELDARIREQQSRRHEAAEARGKKVDLGRQGRQVSAAVVSSKANALIVTSMQMPRMKNLSHLGSQRKMPNSHQEESTFNRHHDAPKNSDAANELRKGIFDHPYEKSRHSMPMTRGATWPDVGYSSGAQSSSRFTSLAEAASENQGPRNNYEANLACRLPRLMNELENSRSRDWLFHLETIANLQQLEGKPNINTIAFRGCRSKDDQIHISGPLFTSSEDMDRMLRRNDKQIQEASRRAQLEKSWRSKGQPNVRPATGT